MFQSRFIGITASGWRNGSFTSPRWRTGRSWSTLRSRGSRPPEADTDRVEIRPGKPKNALVSLSFSSKLACDGPRHRNSLNYQSRAHRPRGYYLHRSDGYPGSPQQNPSPKNNQEKRIAVGEGRLVPAPVEHALEGDEGLFAEVGRHDQFGSFVAQGFVGFFQRVHLHVAAVGAGTSL